MSEHDSWHFPRTATHASSRGLIERMLAPANVASAWERVRKNDGAPGVDGVRVCALQDTFSAEWPQLEHQLRHGKWQPLPVRRVRVPKLGGGTRVLGIPAVMDRVVHQAIVQVLTPLWEPRFSPRSFAYRRGRGAREALDCLAAQAGCFSGQPAALHLDIRQFFDCVPHAQALRAVRKVTDDAPLSALVESILAAGAVEDVRIVPTDAGLPQGSPLSPLLANAVLHPLDLWLDQENLAFARYADDIVALVPSASAAQSLLPLLSARLAKLGLELNTKKTSVTALDEVSFLGFSMWQSTTGRWHRRITPEAWAALDSELSRRDGLVWAAFGGDAAMATDYLTGWLAHFGITECPRDQEKIARLRARHQQPSQVPPVRVAIPYDGGSALRRPAPSQSPPGSDAGGQQGAAHPPWLRTLHLWLARLRAGRLLRVGLDFSRRKGGILPRPTALRLTLLGFTIRLRL